MAGDQGLPRTEQGGTLIRMAVCDIATFLDSLVMVLGVYHVVLDSANAYFGILLATESQDQFGFT